MKKIRVVSRKAKPQTLGLQEAPSSSPAAIVAAAPPTLPYASGASVTPPKPVNYDPEHWYYVGAISSGEED